MHTKIPGKTTPLNKPALLLLAAAALGACADAPHPVIPGPPRDTELARFSLSEPLARRWSDELVHFDVDLPADTSAVHLVDAAGAPAPVELEITARAADRAKARVWTTLTLEPDRAATLSLRAGEAPPAPGAVSVRREPGVIVLANDRLEIALPAWSGGATDLRALPAPIRAVRQPGHAWIGESRWTRDDATPAVREAETQVIAEGPVRASIKQRLRFADGHAYEATITLGARQEAALIAEDSDAPLPKAGYRLTLPGSITWHNQWGQAPGAAEWALVHTPPSTGAERVVAKLRPWSFWWLPIITEWAGFRGSKDDTLVGVLALRPSRWTPTEWNGFDRTELPISARADGRAEIAFGLDALPNQPLHREWALSAVTTPRADTPAAHKDVLRAQLVKYGEFPLDEVKGWGFDAPIEPRPHPSLLFDASAVARARRAAKTDPVFADRVRAAIAMIDGCGDLEPALQKGGALALYDRYAGHGLQATLPEAYFGSDDPRYRRWLAAAVEGLARRVIDVFLDKPERPALGAYGPWFSEEITRLVLNWDLVADAIPPEREAAVRRAMILGAHVLAHPDYWNPARGLASANPNMTASILLPRGLLGVALAGHPEAAAWRRDAEEELAREIEQWISPGGAWVESPGYQAASLDGMFLLAQALKNGGGRDWFADRRLRDTLDYSGFLITAPDRRFHPKGVDPPMVQPSVGHTFAGFITPFNGWMAAATAADDPAFAARQQFYWKRQASTHANAGRAKGFIAALTNPDLPDTPPLETSRAFPGFGSVIRSSWTDPRQSYVALRTGPNAHHYDAEYGSIVYYAKGAPLCLDWGNVYAPLRRMEAWYHNAVSFEAGEPARFGMTGEIVDVRSLPGFADETHGISRGGGAQQSHRDLLLVESPDPLGANYLVIRDRTVDGQPKQRFYYNLFCLAREPVIQGDVAHFPGQMGVDLDVFFLSPRGAPITTDHWGWKQHIHTWGDFAEEQYGIRVAKEGSREDFFTVLYPRLPKERAPKVQPIADGAGARVEHGEGVDVVLLAPGRPAELRDGGASLAGEIALARRGKGGAIRLAVLAGAGARAELGGWGLSSSGPAALDVAGAAISGVSSGDAHEVRITLPPGRREAVVRVDGAPATVSREGRTLALALPAGTHRFTIGPR